MKTVVNTIDAKHLQSAVDRAVSSVASGGGPFGATLVGRDPVSGKALSFTDNNHVTENNDPTAHAEVSVIRSACKWLDTYSLEGFTLYSSCEPCPMCLAAALWARVDRVVFSADRYDAADAGFDDLAFYEKLSIDTAGLEFVERIQLDTALAPFQAWQNKTDKVEY